MENSIAIQSAGLLETAGGSSDAGPKGGPAATAGDRAAPDLRHHQPSGRGKDDADRKAPPLRRGDPARRGRQGQEGGTACDERLDGDREGAGDLRHDVGHEVPLRGVRDQPPGHPRPPGLLRGHLPGPHRRGQRADGHRQRQRGRAPDREAHGGLPDEEHPDHDLHQQAGPGRDEPDGDPREHRGQAPDRVRPALLADRHGEGLQGGLQPLPEVAPPLHAGQGQPEGEGDHDHRSLGSAVGRAFGKPGGTASGGDRPDRGCGEPLFP